MLCITKARGRLNQAIEHSRESKGRATDDLENVGHRGLLSQRLFQLTTKPGNT